MTDQTFKPEKITKPIQLLGAWLAGLLSIDSCFLFAAAHLQQGSWESGALTIAAIVNVPLFLGAVFLLQTKFRPELQEDSYYSTYLSRKTNQPIKVGQGAAHFVELRQELGALEQRLLEPPQVVGKKSSAFADLTIGINRHLADKDTILKKLAECGVIGTTLFGADDPPESRVVAISQYLPKDVFREVVHLASELGFRRYTRYDNRQEQADEDVLFGAYGSGEFEIAE
jgi:hypothetical protein